MPGTIQVSILELVGLPSTSDSSARVSIKVSVGKRAYEMQQKGDCSFPLTSLRDNLAVLVHDGQGNQIACTVVETRLIVERGTWDDLFPLEGGGRLHMRLLFSLSEEEQSRIRSMRESALRKKQEDLLIKNHKSSKIMVASGDQQKNMHQVEGCVGNAKNQATKVVSAGFGPEIKSYTDRREDTLKVASSQVEKIPLSRNATQVVQHHDPGEKVPSKKTPSSVKKMLFAFESSSPQEGKPRTSPAMAKPQVTRDKGTGSKNIAVEDVETEKPSLARIRELSVPEYTGKLETRGASHEGESNVETEEPTDRKGSNEKNEFELNLHEAEDNKEKKRSSRESRRSFASETTELFGRFLHVLHPAWDPRAGLVTEQRCSGDPSVLKKWSVSHLNRAEERRNLGLSCGKECDSFRSWIFLEEMICPCIATDGRRVIDLLEGFPFDVVSETCQVKLVDSSVTPIERVKTPSALKKDESDSSEKLGASKGPVGQAVKIAVMVGFGLLVLLTRQRKS